MEDEILIAEDLKHKVCRLGHTVVGHAMTGESAVQMVTDEQPDVVFMDVRLRGKMNGLKAAQLIRAAHPVAVVFVTAHANTISEMTATQPAPLVIPKPFTSDRIASVIKTACHGR